MKMYEMRITKNQFWAIIAVTTLAVALNVLVIGALSYELGQRSICRAALEPIDKCEGMQ
jgi:hypothetical protein